MKNKKAEQLMYQVIMHLILIGVIFGLFYLATIEKTNSRYIKQQVLEKQLALLIDSSEPDTVLIIKKSNIPNGNIDNIQVDNAMGRIFVRVNGLNPLKGYPYFTRNKVSVTSDELRFYIKIEKK